MVRLKPFRLLGVLPWLILGLGGAETWFAWTSADRVARTALEGEFAALVGETVLSVEARLRANEQVLRGVAGLVANDPEVTRAGFKAYVEGLSLGESFPGIQGVGLSVVVPGKARAAHTERIRREGFPDYAIWPPGERDIYSAIVYLEPFSGRNLRAFGYDMYSEPIRQAAMARAADTGATAMSGKIRLVQEDVAPQSGFLIYVPIYRSSHILETPRQRRDALLGWAYSPLRMQDMLRNMMGGQLVLLEGMVRLLIFDGDSTDPESLLFDSDSALGKPERPAFRLNRQIAFGGRPWTVQAFSLPAFDKKLEAGRARLIAFVGIALTGLLALLAWVVGRGQREVAAALERATLANRALDDSRNLLQLIYDTSDVAIFLVDLEGRITHANRCMEEMFGCPAERLIGSEYVSHIHPDEREAGRARMLALLKKSDVALVEVDRLYWRDDGVQFWGHLRGRRVVDAQSRTVGLVGVISNIDERRRLQADLERQARTDSLTGANNRRHFLELAEAEINRAGRYGSALSVLMIDVDFFKAVNDTHGHAAGDLVLCRLTDICRAGLRETDPIGRMGGEEFAVLLPETDLAGGVDVAERLRAKIAATSVAQPQGPPLRFTVSIGVATFKDRDGSLDGLLRAADDALYKAKRGGRNRVCAQAAAEDRA
jgi:diguanylate cyclase (GGDEF)-like protein/PAS domain S-box-containing protein